MRPLAVAIFLVLTVAVPAFAGYTPPDMGGPGSSGSSGTRLQR
jgi:hypothetical protein